MTGFNSKRKAVADKLQDGKCKLCIDGCAACDARAQPTQEQWKCVGPPCKCNASNAKQCCYAVFTTPPKREWVGLTDEEREGVAKDYSLIGYKSPFKEIEAKLKEKNT